MRGARGIEFGVDLPAIPALGLGSSPHKTSSGVPGSAPTAQGDGWGFGDWTRFVGAWKKSKADDAAAKAGGAPSSHKRSPEESEAYQQGVGRISASPSSPFEILEEKRQKERLAEDHLVKSADTLSVVFDWLIERVPAPKQILGRSSTTLDSTITSKVSGATDAKTTHDKEMGETAVLLTPGPSCSSSNPSYEPGSLPPSAAPPSEMKRLMAKEDKGRKKNELASKADLERFYIALSRKLYDEGL